MSKVKKSSYKSTVITLLASAVIFTSLMWSFSSYRVTWIDRMLSIAATPFMILYHKAVSPAVTFYSHYYDYKALVQERDFYKKQYVTLQSSIIEQQASTTFDQATEKIEQFKNRYNTSQALLCKVLVRRLSDAEQIFMVNAGSRHGVTKNMLAVYGSTLLGKITEVYPYYSMLQLVTDKKSRVAVYCYETKSKGIVEGKNNKDLLSLSYVDCLQPLKVDDTLISSGEGLIFPEGFGVGKIITYVPQELHYAVQVIPLYDFSSIDYCYLIPYETCAYTPVLNNK